MTTLTTNPTYPVPARPCELVFTLTESGTNFVRVWVTVAPEGSALDTQLAKERKTRLEVYAGNGNAEFPFIFTPDKGGKYTLVAQEYTKGNAVGGDYEDDPRGAPAETKVGSEATLSLYVGQRLTQQLGTGQDAATLALWVWNATIRATTVEVHGELTPAIVPGTPTTQAAKNTAESPGVVAAVAALAGVAVDTAIGTMGTLVANFVTRWNAHVASTTFHANADAVNPLPLGLQLAHEPGKLREFVNQALLNMRQHFTNDNGNGEIDSADFHNVDFKLNDWSGMPIVPSVNSVQEAYAGFAELHRSYEAHRQSNAVTHVASAAQSDLTATTSATITIPTVAVDDVLIVAVTNRDATAAPSVTDNDAGGNLWARADSGNDGLTVWWKRATAATTAKVITASGATGSIACGLSVFRGCRTSGNPYENIAKESNSSGNESHAAITPTLDNAHVVLIVANRTDDLGISAQAAASNPAALTERIEVLNTGGNDCSVMIASAAQFGPASSTGALTWEQTNAVSISCAFDLVSSVGGNVHRTVDATALTALPPLLSLHSAFFGGLAANSPTPPPAQSSGAVLLVQRAGFSESS